MKMMIITSLSVIAALAASIVPRIAFLLDNDKYSTESGDTYDYR